MKHTKHDKKWHEEHPLLLPDERGISSKLTKRIKEAITGNSLEKYYLDLETLEVCKEEELIGYNKEQCFVIPYADPHKMRELMEFNLGLMKDPVLEEDWEKKWAPACKKLEELLTDKSLSALDIECEMHKTYPYHMGGWYQGKEDYLWEVMQEWLCAWPILAKDNPRYWFGDEDCSMCQYMLAVEEGWISQTEQGVMGAMQQANLKQGLGDINLEQ